MQNSIHVARWIAQLEGRGWDLHLFPVSNAAPHPALSGVTIHWPLARFWPRLTARLAAADPLALLRPPLSLDRKLFPRLRTRSLVKLPSVGAVDLVYRFAPGLRGAGLAPRPLNPFGPALLTRLVDRLKPDLVHSMEFQNAGYKALWAKERAGSSFPPWLATNWGSDIYHYRTIPEHRLVIERLLRQADFYSCECERDVGLARELGFSGHALPVMPNTGGFEPSRLAALASGVPPSRRRVVMVKGYEHFAGRALTALAALERCRAELQDYRIIVFSATPNVRPRIRELARSGLPIEYLLHAPHDEMLRLHGQARIYLGVGVSDAISTSMLEAMAMGAFPIQTDTSCCEEWIEDSESGFVVRPDDVDGIAARVRRALADDALVDRAAALNAETVRTRLDADHLRRRAHALYDEVFASIAGRPAA